METKMTTKDRLERAGFTLIELLIVIAIIAILASMLLPALNKVRETSKRINCVNNLKQLSLVAFDYTDNHNGYFPFYPPMEILINSIKGNNVSKNIAKGVPYQCPSDLSAFDLSLTISSGSRYSYGENMDIINHLIGGVKGKVKLPSIKYPSRTPFWAETRPFTGTKYYDTNGTQASSRSFVDGTNASYNCATRHAKGSNYVSVAGDVQWLIASKLNSNQMLYWTLKL